MELLFTLFRPRSRLTRNHVAPLWIACVVGLIISAADLSAAFFPPFFAQEDIFTGHTRPTAVRFASEWKRLCRREERIGLRVRRHRR